MLLSNTPVRLLFFHHPVSAPSARNGQPLVGNMALPVVCFFKHLAPVMDTHLFLLRRGHDTKVRRKRRQIRGARLTVSPPAACPSVSLCLFASVCPFLLCLSLSVCELLVCLWFSLSVRLFPLPLCRSLCQLLVCLCLPVCPFLFCASLSVCQLPVCLSA